MANMQEDLRNYQLQLQQVEAALLSDTANEELLKLKGDLEEVIELTKDLIRTQEGDAKKPEVNTSNDDDVTASLLAAEGDFNRSHPTRWQPGETCLAKTADGTFHEAVIDKVSKDSLTVKFDGYTTFETVSLQDVKRMGSALKRQYNDDDGSKAKAHSKEYLKKRKQKKQQRFKQIEDEREGEKNKWLNFKTKSSKKPGVVAKSIFASPDNLSGRVGIGTCGISGRPMTDYTPGEKWKKGG